MRYTPLKCHSSTLPATAAFKLSTRSVIGMRTAMSQASTVLSVRPCPSLPMTTHSPPGKSFPASSSGRER